MKRQLIILVFFASLAALCFGQHIPPPKYFDWDKTNADRFVNSPCFHSLGFNPDSDPVEQERRYRECEESHRNKQIGNFFIGAGKVLIAVFLIGFFLMGYRIRSERRRY